MLSELVLSKETIAALAGALMGGGLSFVGTWITQRHQRLADQNKLLEERQRLKEEKMYQIAVDLTAAAYAFLSVTWSAANELLDQETIDAYYDDIQKAMPRIFGDYVILAGLDHELGAVAGRLINGADELDVRIGEAGGVASKEATKKLKAIRQDAENFADRVRKELVASMKKMRESHAG